MSGAETFRFGILGAGGIAVKFCQAVSLVQGAEVAAVASKDGERAARFAADHGVPLHYGNYAHMLREADLDAVYIATTVNYHYENCMLCLEHGKAVLCEKSMVRTVREAEEIFHRAREKGLFVMEAMWSRFLPAVQTARRWIGEGRIGKPALATYTGGVCVTDPRSRLMRSDLGGGAMYDLASYPVEIVTFLLDRPVVGVKSRVFFGETGVDTENHILLDFGDCRAALQCTMGSRVPSPAAVYGSKGYVTLHRAHQAEACELYNNRFELVERFEAPHQNGFTYEIEEVIRCVREELVESPVMPHSATLECAGVFERCLGETSGKHKHKKP